MKSILGITLLAALFSTQAMAHCDRDSQFSYCAGDAVIDRNGRKGRVSGVFGSGTVMVKYPGYSRHKKRTTSGLAVTRGCSKRTPFCVGTRVINSNGLAGTIKGIFQNGEVAVWYQGYYSRYKTWPTSGLAIRRGCTYDDYCVGDKIINDNGLAGTVKGIFQNGEVAVWYQGYYSRYKTWPTSGLAVTDACVDRDILYFND